MLNLVELAAWTLLFITFFGHFYEQSFFSRSVVALVFWTLDDLGYLYELGTWNAFVMTVVILCTTSLGEMVETRQTNAVLLREIKRLKAEIKKLKEERDI